MYSQLLIPARAAGARDRQTSYHRPQCLHQKMLRFRLFVKSNLSSWSRGAVLPHVGPMLFSLRIQYNGSPFLPPQSTLLPEDKLSFRSLFSKSLYLRSIALSTWTFIEL